MLSCTPSPFGKAVYSEMKELATLGANYFLSYKGSKNTFKSIASPSGVFIILKYI